MDIERARKSGRGCLVVVGVFGAIIGVSIIVGGILVYRFSTSEEGKTVINAVGESTKLAQQTMNAPGTKQLREIGCDTAMVLDDEQVARMANLSMDANARLEDPLGRWMVSCNVGVFGTPPSCDRVAATYVSAIGGTAPRPFTVSVSQQGKGETCMRSYEANGSSSP